MAAASLLKTRKDVRRGRFAPVYYVTGDEDVLKDDFVAHVIEHAVDEASRDFNVDVRSAADLDAEALSTLVETPPMLAERRVAVVRNIEYWRKNSRPWKTLIQYVAHPSPTTTLVLVVGPGQDPDQGLVDASTHLEAEFRDPEEVADWVEARAEGLGLRMAPAALTHLIEVCGRSPSRVLSELDKLAAATEPGAPVTEEAVSALVGVYRGETPDDWIDAALHRDVARAVTLLDVVLQQTGVTAVRLLMNLGTALLGTRLAREHLDHGPAGRVKGALFDALKRTRPRGIGRWGTEVDRWASAAARWSASELDRAIRAAYDADEQLKSTTLADDRGTLINLLLTFHAPGDVT